MRLGIVYHTRFWQAADGSLWESEGSFARYVDSLAPYFDQISLCVPVRQAAGGGGCRVWATNVHLAPLPDFDGPRHFYPRLPSVLRALSSFIGEWDMLHCRVPTPAAFPAFAMAQRHALPVFLLVVGDLQGLVGSLPYRGAKRLIYRTYVAWEEWGLKRMIRRSLTFTNGEALYRKHRRHGPLVMETKTTTIRGEDIADRGDTCSGSAVRLLCVSRIDPRKGLRCFPRAVERLRKHGHDVRLDIVGPVVGKSGEDERRLIMAEASRVGVQDVLRFLGAMPLDALLPLYREYDLFALPTLPGEGIPRVLLEAMAAGLPIITTGVAGIPSLVRNGVNGLLMPESSASAVADAVERLLEDPALRRSLIAQGYETARLHTLEYQARWMMERVAAHTGCSLSRHA